MKTMLTKTVLILALLSLLGVGLVGPVVADDIEDELDDLNDRVDALELKTAKDVVSFFGDFRVKYDYLKFEYPAYTQFAGVDTMGMPVFIPKEAQTLSNDENWSLRLRLKIDAKPTDELHFTGRLCVHQTYGGFGVPIFNGFPNTVAYDANSTSFGGDNIVRLERAAFTYSPSELPMFFTLGRQAANGGPPRELREDRVRQATPGALMIDAEIDGVMIGFHVNEIIKGVPEGSNLRICYGTGYESGFGSGGRTEMAYTTIMTMNGPYVLSNLQDSKVVGGCFETNIPPIPGKTLLSGGFFRMLDMTDISTGYTRNFPNPMDTDPQLVTATRNLGDMDLIGVCFQHEYGNYAWFASYATNKSHPDKGAESAYGFGGLLGNSMGSETGAAYYVGGRVNVPTMKTKFGLEYNHGDEHWFSYTNGADDFAMSKLATRGNVIEGYFIHELESKLNLRAGFQLYTYDYAFSGWHIAPGPMSSYDLSQNYYSPYPFPDKATNIYAILDLTF